MKTKMKNLVLFLSSFSFLSLFYAPAIVPTVEENNNKINNIKKSSSSNQITLYVYNSEDYIAEDEKDDENNIIRDGVIAQFEQYEKEQGKNVKVIYDCFDTNENMLSQLRMGNDKYDVICTSDYVVQKMIQEDMIIPFENDAEELFSSTPNYQDYGSKFIKETLAQIDTTINGEKKYLMNQYSRGYMWGTLGLLYNTTFKKLEKRDIDASKLEEDMNNWSTLWQDEYRKLLSIKDSMRDTYAIGILKTYEDDFELNGKNYYGFKTLSEKFNNGELSESEYRKLGDEIFNLCDNETVNRVKKNLITLRDNAYGFEVDSGKSDMAKGQYFAINLAWSGDACWAMDMADEFNEEHEENYPDDESFNPTILKYQLPNTGANIWCDSWVISKAATKHGSEDIAKEFVDFLSNPEIACQNMDYIGYTSCIAGDEVLNYVKECNDIRYDEEKEEFDDSILHEYTLYDKKDILSLDEEELEQAIYSKDISYFFEDTLDEEDNATLYIYGSERNRQFDASYPDKEKLPSLFMMKDYGKQNSEVVKMWQQVKNKYLPVWVYVIVLVLIAGAITLIVYNKIKKNLIIKRRKEARKSSKLTTA